MKFKDLSIEEKFLLLTGKDGWHTHDLDGKIPSIKMKDGPHGLVEEGTVAMPCLQNLGNSWSEEAAYFMSSAIADDCRKNDVDMLLAPGINIKRNAVCGRNFEYISEDPYLSGMLAKQYVKGLQDRGVAATLKHFCANNREYGRFTTTSEIDERTIREIYIEAFRIALEADPWAIMCSYNLLNGWYASENKWLLKKVLRNDMGYKGLIVSDWAAVHDRAKSLKATLDLEMPYMARSLDNLKQAYADGYITDDEVNASVERIEELYEKIRNARENAPKIRTREECRAIAQRVAEEGIVLLKNEDNILPLKSPRSIALIGEQSRFPEISGGGSAYMSKKGREVKSLIDLLKGEYSDCEIKYSGAYMKVSYVGQRNREWLENISLRDAYESEYAIVCVGNNPSLDTEFFDRENIKLPIVQEHLINDVCEYNKNVIVIVTAGSAIDMSSWIDKVKAVIYTGFGGEAMSEALCNIICGKTCPSGKLSETFINSENDNPANSSIGNGFVERYTDGIMVGYKYYEKNHIPVQFPFGFGLSYASFEYSDLRIEKLGDYEYKVSYKVTNTSEIEAKEVSQLYIKNVMSMVEQPPKALKGFAKTTLAAGETKEVTHLLDMHSFAYYSVVEGEWFVEDGWYEVLVGASCEDIRLKDKIKIQTDPRKQNSKFDEIFINDSMQ